MKRSHKKILAGFFSLALLIVMFLWLMGSLTTEPKVEPGREEVPAKSAAGLKTLEVTISTVPIEIEAVGTVTARESAEISSRIMAAVSKVAADAGDTVKKGQTLFTLDSRDAEARLTQAREQLAAAKAALERAELEAARIANLYEKEAATKREHEQAQAALKMAHASVDAAEASVREAEANLSYTVLRSPVNGRVVDRLADPGDMAVPGTPLMTIYDPATLRLEVSVPEQLRPKVRVGDTVKTSINPLGLDFDGEILEIIPASDAASRTFTMRVSIPPADAVHPGMYGHISLQTGTTETILIPPETLIRVGQLEMVTVVENATARTRAVKTGKTYPAGVEVLAGLSAGEHIAFPTP
ncbi:MAG: efflux RND transporter periplasmic adaptor subunit [Candidatus Abyssubacteria bacterium]